MTAQNAQAGTDAQSQAGIHTYTLPQPIRQQGSHQIAVSALWRRRGSNAFTMFLGAFGILVLLSFIITGIGGIQYRFEQMHVTNHGDDPHLVVTFTDVVIILMCVVGIVIPSAIIIFFAWGFIADIPSSRTRHRFVRDPHTLGVHTDGFAPGIVIVRQPDCDDGDDDSDDFPIPRILFCAGTPIEFRMLAYVPESMWVEAGGGQDPCPSWRHRHHMAWLTLRIEGGAIAITALKPIPVRPVRQAFDTGKPNRTIFDYDKTPGIERYDSDYIILDATRVGNAKNRATNPGTTAV
ncbi:hypothetical protein [Bifidobacterium myosotis]|uniref:Uncharacterized protein n=1 Tax=Bifidobacterium myosotis TaxID=1630166 RepID=A0A5M9ZJJ6_9BIFI|nr:hypothetical protein [Bifidobacterium myosotis]KAA8827668.1 hypothetical protein EMO91_07405 [Bifidobacterium myosotis]